jgi:putative ABC transport system permease protein
MAGLAYTKAFANRYHEDCKTSAVAAEKTSQQIYRLDLIKQGYVSSLRTLRQLGAEELPNEIKIFVKDFDCKDAVTSHLDKWNDEIKKDDEGAQIQYTDTVAILMTLVRSMLDAVTYVLVAFTAISLVVSSVMIGVITYVSVVERTKEIGVLRSLGARKKDIRRLFNAETFLIGLFSGAIGVGFTYLVSVPINLILGSLTGISTLAALPLHEGLIMVCVSIVLTLISGLVPAQAAARKDPVIALRTE